MNIASPIADGYTAPVSARNKSQNPTFDKEVKCVVWDLDDTLWHGILAEQDVLVLKPWVLETIQTLDRRGILQSVASKNHHQEAWNKLQAFGLAEYFLYPQIHWGPKSASLEQIRKNLNIGIDTFLFVDDQPFERDEVQAVHSEVEGFDAANGAFLLNHPRLNPKRISDDAAQRRSRYLEDMVRKEAEENYVGTPEAFLTTLGLQFTIKLAGLDDLLRCEELTLRTNQLNSTGVTYDLGALESFMRSPVHTLLVCELTDRYGSYGTIGLALLEHQNGCDLIKLLLMSCRTASRGVGGVLLSYLMKQSQARGKKLRADFRRTDRNRQMWVTYRFANFQVHEQLDENRMILENDLRLIQPYPHFISLDLPKVTNH